MVLKELNSDILIEKDMADLAKAFNTAKAELKTDVEVRINRKIGDAVGGAEKKRL